MQPAVFWPIDVENPKHRDDATISHSLTVRVVDGNRSILPVTLGVTSRYSFRLLSHIAWSWHLKCDRSIGSIHCDSFELAQGARAILKFDEALSKILQLEKTRHPDLTNSYHLNIRGFLKDNTESWAGAGHTLVKQQFRVRFEFDKAIQQDLPPMIRQESHCFLEISSDNIAIWVARYKDGVKHPFAVVEKSTGSLTSYAPRGANLLAGPIVPNFTRAETDNDKGGLELALDFIFPGLGAPSLHSLLHGNEDFSYWSRWRSVGLSQDDPPQTKCLHSPFILSDDRQHATIEISCNIVAQRRRAQRGGDILLKRKVLYTIHADGRLRMSSHIVPQSVLHQIPSLPRVGVSVEIDPSLFRIRYSGRGPDEVRGL